MGFNISEIIGSGITSAISSIGDVAKKFIHTKEDQEAFDLAINKIQGDTLKTLTEDVQSARNREIQVNLSESASWLSKNTVGILALGITLGFFGMLAWMLNYNVPAENKDILNIMLGSLGTAWIGVTSYYFGSSIGSKSSGEALRKIAQEK